MVTMKFGGTSVTPRNFRCLKQLHAENRCVVVSAVGKEFDADEKVTDLLRRHFDGDESAWKKIEDKFLRLVSENGVVVDVEKLLHEAKSKSLISLSHCLSLGEELTARVAAVYLGVPYLEAESLVRFDRGRLCVKCTLDNLKSAFKGLKSGVVGGFYGGCENGRCVFSRGGGDVSGSLCAAATDSVIYENVTDVNGVCDADPKIVCGAKTILSLSYAQMFIFAKCGAVVLHPDAVKIARDYGVPIRVSNCRNQAAASTIVSNCPSTEKFLAVTERRHGSDFVATVIHSFSTNSVFEALHKLSQCDLCGFDVVKDFKMTENILQTISSRSILQQLFCVFRQCR